MTNHVIGIIGAGPASLYAAEKLSKAGHEVVILNRDIKHGGLAEFGIYPNKYKMKIGLRKVFHKILSHPNVHYYGDVLVSESGDFTLEELSELGFAAIVVAVGAQGTKWLGLPGEQTHGVWHAKDLVYHYNNLPPFSEMKFDIGQRACVVGLGNVALDIVHWLVCERKIEEVTLVARRGPGERAYTDKEMKIVAGALDFEAIEAEFESIRSQVESMGQNPDEFLDELKKQAEAELECETPTKLKIRYLRSPAEIVGTTRVEGLLCDVMELQDRGETVGVKRTENQEVLPCDTVVFAIGDSIEPSIGLPLSEDAKTFATLQEPWDEYPERERYRVRDPKTGQALGNVFVVGWARKASDGLVGKARVDATLGCDEILAFLDGKFGDEIASRSVDEIKSAIETRERELQKTLIRYEEILQLEEIERKKAQELGLEEFKFSHRKDILNAIEGES